LGRVIFVGFSFAIYANYWVWFEYANFAMIANIRNENGFCRFGARDRERRNGLRPFAIPKPHPETETGATAKPVFKKYVSPVVF